MQSKVAEAKAKALTHHRNGEKKEAHEALTQSKALQAQLDKLLAQKQESQPKPKPTPAPAPVPVVAKPAPVVAKAAPVSSK